MPHVASGIGTTTPVGCFPSDASPYDLVDVAGNIGEWTATPGTDNYQTSDGTAIETEKGERFVNRGDDWSGNPRFARCAYRVLSSPLERYANFGMRVVAARGRGRTSSAAPGLSMDKTCRARFALLDTDIISHLCRAIRAIGLRCHIRSQL